MKLIVEKWDGVVSVYRASNKSFRVFKRKLTTKQLDPAILDKECDIGSLDNFHMVFDIKKPKKRR